MNWHTQSKYVLLKTKKKKKKNNQIRNSQIEPISKFQNKINKSQDHKIRIFG